MRATGVGLAAVALLGVYGAFRGIVYGLVFEDRSFREALSLAAGAAVFAAAVGSYVLLFVHFGQDDKPSPPSSAPADPRVSAIDADLTRLRGELEKVRTKTSTGLRRSS